MENEQVRPEGVEVGSLEAASGDSVAGDSVPSIPKQSIEERFAELLEQHHYAINGISSAVMELKGRVDFLEDIIYGDVPEQAGE